MKKRWKLVIAIICTIVIAGTYLIIDVPYRYSSNEFEQIPAITLPALAGITFVENGFTNIGESEQLKMEFDNQTQKIRVYDKKLEQYYNLGFNEEELAVVPKNNKVRQGIRTLCSMSYYDPSGNTGTINTEDDSVKRTFKTLKNGINIDYLFEEQGIGFNLNIWIDGSNLLINIPATTIKETDKYRLMTLDVLPTFFSAKNGSDGYIVFPEGSGALYDFKSSPSTVSPLTRDVYTDRTFDMDKSFGDSSSLEKGVMLPAYGIKKGTGALVAYILEGDENSALTLAPSGFLYEINRIYPTFIYRKIYTYKGPSGTEITESDKEIRIGNATVSIGFLSGESADYSGMSAWVRQLMIKEKRITERIETKFKMKLDIIMGAVEETVLYSKYVSVTDFKQAKQMISELTGKNMNGLLVDMLGWGTNGYGYNPTNSSIARKAGGTDELRDLSSSIKNSGGSLVASANIVFAQNGQKGFSRLKDIVFNGALVPVTNDKNDTFLLNPYIQSRTRNEAMIKLFTTAGVSGISYDGIGNFIFDDYALKQNMFKTDTIAVQKQILKNSRDGLGQAIAEKGNAYILSTATFIKDVPEGTSTYNIFDREIPFYQMVVHGLMGYSSQIAGNLSSDIEKTCLRWLEYGAVPYFVMSWQGSDKLINTQANGVFTSDIKQWENRVFDIYNKFLPIFEKTYDQQIILHKEINTQVFKTVYANGFTVIVNYNENDVQEDGQLIKGKSYAIFNQ